MINKQFEKIAKSKSLAINEIHFYQHAKIESIPKLIDFTCDNNNCVLTIEKIDGQLVESISNVNTLKAIATVLKELYALTIPSRALDLYDSYMHNVSRETVTSLYPGFVEKFEMFSEQLCYFFNYEYPRENVVHGDLAGNIILDNNRIRLIDFEYWHYGDVHFEIASIILRHSILATKSNKIKFIETCGLDFHKSISKIVHYIPICQFLNVVWSFKYLSENWSNRMFHILQSRIISLLKYSSEYGFIPRV